MLSSQMSGSTITKTLLIVCAAIVASCGTSQADTMYVSFTTFLRDGPGLRYRPVDEVLGGSPVDVVGCNNAWCQIWYGAAAGYVAQNSLTKTNFNQITIDDPVCFVNGQTSYHGQRGYRFCYSGKQQTAR